MAAAIFLNSFHIFMCGECCNSIKRSFTFKFQVYLKGYITNLVIADDLIRLAAWVR